MKTKRLIIVLFLIGTLTNALALFEYDKIQGLLDKIEKSNLIFIRNGVEYSAKKAREHLELKLSKAGSRISTAEQFIRYIASKSAWTGKYYYVKYPDGTRIKTADWMRMVLKEIEKKSR